MFKPSDFIEWGVSSNLVNKYINFFNKYCEEFNLKSKNRILSFFANLLHESGNFYYVKEDLPTDKPDYVKKLGNYFGRGLMQVTHQKNYKLFNDWCIKNIVNFDVDFVNSPNLLETQDYAVLSAFWYWKSNNLEVYADKNDFLNVCSLINTGKIQDKLKPHTINGLDDRNKKYAIIEKWCIKNKIT